MDNMDQQGQVMKEEQNIEELDWCGERREDALMRTAEERCRAPDESNRDRGKVGLLPNSNPEVLENWTLTKPQTRRH